MFRLFFFKPCPRCDIKWLDYFYDANGSLFGFNYNGANYYYIRNGQNDIIGILDSTGTQVVSYQYDTWGKLLGISGSQASGVGTLNPFRYRGYYYDTETGLYYLNSRYYDPSTGRYLNADGIADTKQGLTGTNMFCYCGNNPVNREDPSGCLSWNDVGGFFCGIGKAIGGFCSATFGASYTSSIETPDIANSNNYGLLGFAGLDLAGSSSFEVSKIGDSSKPISVYAENVNGDATKASAGIKLNIASVNVKLNLSLSDVSVDFGYENGDSEYSNCTGIALSRLSIFSKFDITQNINAKNSTNASAKVYVGLFPLAAAYAYIESGGSVNIWDKNTQPAW